MYDKITIEIEKQDGKAKTDISVCIYDGERRNKRHFDQKRFEDIKKLGKKMFHLKNMFEKSFSAFLKNRSFSNNFHYELEVTGTINYARFNKDLKSSDAIRVKDLPR